PTTPPTHTISTLSLHDALPILEVRIVLPNGANRLLHTLGRAVLNNAGKIVRIVGTSQDITERSKADQKFKALLESAPDAIVIVRDRKSTRLNSSHLVISYAVFC